MEYAVELTDRQYELASEYAKKQNISVEELIKNAMFEKSRSLHIYDIQAGKNRQIFERT